jgi:ubiquinone/menaquinone biosynthesis C-methylase UbiE
MKTNNESIYQLNNVPIFEALYGKGLISLGGYQAVDRLFDKIPLAGKHLLDIGSGIGGIAHYLAAHYQAKVTGLEIHPWMADYAKQSAEKTIKQAVNFITYNNDGSIPLKATSIDIAYSKGVLTNVKNKKQLFKEVTSVLKPGGDLYLIDWLVPEEVGPSSQRLNTGEASYKETRQSYRDAILTPNGFQQIIFTDVSKEYLVYTQDLQRLLSSDEHQKKYETVLPNALRKQLLKSNANLIDAIKSGKQFSTRIHAVKVLHEMD